MFVVSSVKDNSQRLLTTVYIRSHQWNRHTPSGKAWCRLLVNWENDV